MALDESPPNTAPPDCKVGFFSISFSWVSKSPDIFLRSGVPVNTVVDTSVPDHPKCFLGSEFKDYSDNYQEVVHGQDAPYMFYPYSFLVLSVYGFKYPTS